MSKKYATDYEVPPLSRKDLRYLAKEFRRYLKIKTICFPIVELLEMLFQIGVNYDIIDNAEWEKEFGNQKHAEYNLSTRTINIKEDIYNRAVLGHGRDRFTIAHEIAHVILLDDKAIKLAKKRGDTTIPLCKNPEWQADCLAGELLIPYHLCKDMDAYEISQKCRVSLDAAIYQKSKFQDINSIKEKN